VSNLIPNTDWGQDRTVAELPLHEAHFIKISTTCGEAIDLIRTKGFDQFPVKNADGKTVGVLTAVNLHSRLAKNQVKLSDPITRCVVRDLRQVSKNVKLNELARVLTRNSFVLVEDKYFISINDVLDCHNPKKEYIAKQDSEPIQLSKPVRVTKEEEV
jgi:predicted transcriptional regulator